MCNFIMVDESRNRDIAEAVKGIVQAVPIYEDAIQPAAKQIGKGLETIAKAMQVALEPLAGLVWGYDRFKEQFLIPVAEKLRNVPPDRITTPSFHVAGPIVEALRFTGHEESLRELYANLLATSLDAETTKNAHPSFVDIIKNMSPDEARIIRLFATSLEFPVISLHSRHNVGMAYNVVVRNFSYIGREAACEHPELVPSYLDNLCRLGLIEIPPDRQLSDVASYEPLQSAHELATFREQIDALGDRTVAFDRKVAVITTLGEQFCQACVIEKGSPSAAT